MQLDTGLFRQGAVAHRADSLGRAGGGMIFANHRMVAGTDIVPSSEHRQSAGWASPPYHFQPHRSG